MAGYWPSSFLACLWTETKSRSINSQKKNEANIQPLDRTSLVNKGFIIWLLVKFCWQDTAGSPKRARWLHLARLGSQSQRAIWFILPVRKASHIINCDKTLLTFETSAAHVFYISLVFSNAHCVISQCNTPRRLLYLLNNAMVEREFSTLTHFT